MAGPFFVPDLSAWQGDLPNFDAIAADPRMAGCIIKATQGVTYAPKWFTVNWPRVRAAGGSRYGRDWFRGCYHYATPSPSGTAQADYLLDAVERAGGWGEGDMPPAWDLEGPKWSSEQQIVDVSSQFVARVEQRLGRTPILYTGSTWRQFNVREKAGFKQLWTTHLDKMAPYGWPNTSYVLWQYSGTGKYYDPATASLYGYPLAIPGMAASVDMNVVLDGGAPAASIERVRAVLVEGQRSPPPWPGPPQEPVFPSTARIFPSVPFPSPGRAAAPTRPSVPTARVENKLLVPIAISAGLLFAGFLLARQAKSDLF